jgi:hypothetical protein
MIGDQQERPSTPDPPLKLIDFACLKGRLVGQAPVVHVFSGKRIGNNDNVPLG